MLEGVDEEEAFRLAIKASQEQPGRHRHKRRRAMPRQSYLSASQRRRP
jgi:predicted RNA-binding protein with RPS1 domain